ncbi:NAD(P)H-binding protein [Streptomyces sp. NPDC050560]|uniref:NAD(P)H-binding protein n=1 Tax=Streptomyces sp. NPDC050560 TaxID=3365630 RepID=UPI00379CE445
MILVTGGTGNVGREVVAELVGSGQRVRALARDPRSALFPPGVDVVPGDLGAPDSLAAALDGVRKVFLLLFLPGVDFGKVTEVVARSKVEHVVLLSSVRAASPEGGLVGQVNRLAEDAVRESGRGWTFLRPGAFASNALQWAGGVRSDRVVRAFGGDFRSAPIDPADIAAVAARALVSDAYLGAAPVLSGPGVLTAREQAAVLGDALGEPVAFEELPEDVARGALRRAGYPEPFADAMVEMQKNTDPSLAQVTPAVEEITGTPARGFRRWAGTHVAAFR